MLHIGMADRTNNIFISLDFILISFYFLSFVIKLHLDVRGDTFMVPAQIGNWRHTKNSFLSQQH